MKIKVCCPLMNDYIESLYISLHSYSKRTEYNEKNEVAIDTALYDENEVIIDFCPWCGKKIEIISG